MAKIEKNNDGINKAYLGPRWYVAHTYSGYENKVKTNLEKIIENRGLGHLFFDIRIPTEIVVESDGGVEKEVESKIFPSYVLIKMIMFDETWHIVRNIRGVTGFVGPGSEPVPMSDEEIEALLNEKRDAAPVLAVGDAVDVIAGAFKDFFGVIESISEDGKTAVIIIESISRDTPFTVDTKDLRRKAE